MSIWVCGEVLVDRIGESNILGGGPANTARAIARLGQEVQFIGGISSDKFGVKAREEFTADSVGLQFVHRSEKPTAIAAVSLDANGLATYKFTTADSATFDFNEDWLPDPSRCKPSALHIGTLATVIQPGAVSLFKWATHVSEFAPIIYDPNVRSDVLSDKSIYVEIFERWSSISTVIKASEDDIAWLYPDESESEVVLRIMELGVQLLVLTRGSRGITAFTHDESTSVEGVAIEVADTVG
ncbi:MAG: carbohydrate kinase, partial [Actinobacteria bacterium]|nr:carbohydrate kinase [Actinomycetota bacterium]